MILYLKFADGFHRMKMDARSDISLNFSHDNLDNPTNYISEYSYNLQVPRCPENNKLFSNFVHLDSVVLAGGYDPTKRMDYVLLDNTGTIISTGSAIVNNIDSKNYNLSLVGSQSYIFNRLLNAGFDTEKAASDDTYFLMDDPLKYRKVGSSMSVIPIRLISANNAINSSLVAASWLIDNPQFYLTAIERFMLVPSYGLFGIVSETEAYIASIVGFAPTAQGRYKEFESDVWLEKGTIDGTPAQKPSFLPVLCSARDASGDPINKVDVQDGTVDAQMLEYRSYYQQPYIYVSMLWQLFAREFEGITEGYRLILDGRWFSPTNQELNRLVYMLPQLATDLGGYIDTIPSTQKYVSKYMPQTYDIIDQTDYPVGGVNHGQVEGLKTLNYTSTSNEVLVQSTKLNKISVTADVTMQINGKPGKTMYFDGFNPFLYTLTVRDGNNNILTSSEALVFMLPNDHAVSYEDLTNFMYVEQLIRNRVTSGGDRIITVFYDPVVGSGNLNFSITNEVGVVPVTNGGITVEAVLTFENNCAPYMYIEGGVQHYWYNGQLPLRSLYGYVITGGTIEKAARSNSTVSLERLFTSEAPFNVLLKYSKLHHLMWLVDDNEKTVTVLRSVDYYADRVAEGIRDITDKVDVMQGVVTKPLSWNSRRVIFNLDEPSVDGVDGYADRYGQSYGSKVIVTASNLNRDDKELLKGIVSSVMFSQNLAPCGQLLYVDDKRMASYMEQPPLPANRSNGECASVSGNFYYRHNNGLIPAEMKDGWRDAAYITDDHAMETRDSRFCWHGEDIITDEQQCSVLPVLNTVSDDGLSVLFAPVQEQYTYAPDEPTEYLYERCWKDYIEEVYNLQNKTIQVYAHINKELYDYLRRNPFVTIQNCLYILTSLEGWGEHATTCRLTLRQVHDLTKLTGGATLPIATEILTEDGEELLCEDDDNLIQE